MAAQQALADQMAAHQAAARQQAAAEQAYAEQREAGRRARARSTGDLIEIRLPESGGAGPKDAAARAPFVTSFTAARRTNSPPACAGLGVKLRNPAGTGGSVSYAVDSQEYTINPGQIQYLKGKGSWVIEFDRGGGYGLA